MPGTPDQELIKTRVTELADMAEALAENEASFVTANLQLLRAVLKPMHSMHVASLARHLNKISSIVLNTDCSKEEYDAAMAVAIQEAMTNENKD